MHKSTLYRCGGACLIVGALITGIANGLHPDVPLDSAAMVAGVAASASWSAIHWALLIGLAVMQLGFIAVMFTLRDDPTPLDAGGWGRLGLYTLLTGFALWGGVFATEVALKTLAVAAQADPALAGGARALWALGDALITAATIVYWLGIGLLGAGLMQASRYPRWSGAIGGVVGAAMAAVGLVRACSGASRFSDEIAFPILAILTLLWTIVLGVQLWRTAGAKRVGRR